MHQAQKPVYVTLRQAYNAGAFPATPTSTAFFSVSLHPQRQGTPALGQSFSRRCLASRGAASLRPFSAIIGGASLLFPTDDKSHRIGRPEGSFSTTKSAHCDT